MTNSNLTLTRPIIVTDDAKAQLVSLLRNQVAQAAYYFTRITEFADQLEEFEFNTEDAQHVMYEATNVFNKVQDMQRGLGQSITQDAFNVIASAASLVRA